MVCDSSRWGLSGLTAPENGAGAFPGRLGEGEIDSEPLNLRYHRPPIPREGRQSRV